MSNCGCNKNIVKKNCGCSVPCGCGDHTLKTPASCVSAPSCFNPEKCSETFSSECVLYMGDSIANLGINKGDSMTKVVQILLLAIQNIGCVDPASPCLSPVGFGSLSITQTTIGLIWGAVPGVLNYQVEYRLTNVGTWTLNPTTTNTNDTIGGLTPNSTYYVRVSAVCGSSSCYSAVLTITTKP